MLIDEFGKGTAPASGMALLAAAIDELSRKRCNVVCTTHFLELFSLNLLADKRGGVMTFKMGVHLPDNSKDSAVPLFKLSRGVANSSDGLLCGKMAGLDSVVMARAEEILAAIKGGTSIRGVRPTELSQRDELEREMLFRFLSNGPLWKNATDTELDGMKESIVHYVDSE